MRNDKKTVAVAGQAEPDSPFRKKCRITWAALIKAVYEVDPLKCPKCGGTMKIVAFIEEPNVIEKILRHSELWKEPAPHPPPVKSLGPPEVECDPELDYQLLSLRFLSVKYPVLRTDLLYRFRPELRMINPA